MLASGEMPNVRWLFVALVVPLLLVACGDGAGDSSPPAAANTAAPPTPRPTTAGSSPVATAARGPDDFGPAPRLGDNVTKVSPEHGTKVTQASTRSPDPVRPGGVCAEVNFEGIEDPPPGSGLPEGASAKRIWFRMAIGRTEVTPELVWIVPSEDADVGRVCFSPEEGLPIGRTTAALVVQDPFDQSKPTKQTVAWEFEVVP